MRPRDIQALAFCVGTTLLVVYVVNQLANYWLVTALLTGAYAAFVFTRPRLLRVYRRMRGEEVERFSYFKNR